MKATDILKFIPNINTEVLIITKAQSIQTKDGVVAQRLSFEEALKIVYPMPKVNNNEHQDSSTITTNQLVASL